VHTAPPGNVETWLSLKVGGYCSCINVNMPNADRRRDATIDRWYELNSRRLKTAADGKFGN